MKNNKNFRFVHSPITQKRVEEAESLLKAIYFELSLSSRIYHHCQTNIHKFYQNQPDSVINPSTLVGCLVYLISSKLNEHVSLSTISEKVGVSSSWLSKKKRQIASSLEI